MLCKRWHMTLCTTECIIRVYIPQSPRPTPDQASVTLRHAPNLTARASPRRAA